MLKENGVDFDYREYRKEPLSVSELRDVVRMLGVPASAILRKRDKAVAQLGLVGDEPDDVLIPHMANHPTMVQRPIGIIDGKAAIGRPPAALLELLKG